MYFLLQSILRWHYQAVASYRISGGLVVSAGGRFQDRWNHDLEELCRIHGISSGLLIIFPIQKRWSVACWGQVSTIRQTIMNTINF